MNRAYEKLCNYTQQCPVTFGVGSIATVKDAMGMLGAKKLFVVYDQGVKMSGLAEKVTKPLDEQGVDYITYDDITAEPVEDVVDKAYEVAKEAGCDGVLGLGGGSPMDTAKIISVLLKKGGKTSDYFLSKLGPIFHDHVPSLMVPTSSGTGSEVTCVAVVSDINHAKDGVLAGPSMAIVDPEMTLTCPPLNTVTSALDAFAHAAEAFTAADVDPVSDQLALEAIRLIMANLDKVYHNGADIEARTRMSMAANMAGIAFSNTGVSFGHAAGHEFVTKFHIGHGLACCYSVPVTLKWNAINNTERARKIAEAMGIEGFDTLAPEELGKVMADIIVKMMKDYKVPTMAEKGATRQACIDLAEDSIAHNQMQYADVVRPIPIEEYREMLAEMYDLSVQ